MTCAECEGILGEDAVVEWEGKSFHEEHFVCHFCKEPFNDGDCCEQEGWPYCMECWKQEFGGGETAATCANCGGVISGAWKATCGSKYHVACFCCSKCSCDLTDSDVVEVDGKPCCVTCSKASGAGETRYICAECDLAIEKGQCSEFRGEAFHTSHLKCSECSAVLEGKNVRRGGESGTTWFCTEHFKAWAATSSCASVCGGCGDEIEGKAIVAAGKSWHPEHLKCSKCDEVCTKDFGDKDGVIYCRKHFNQKFASRCGTCEKPIDGQFVQPEGCSTKFHPECVRCHFCKKDIHPDNDLGLTLLHMDNIIFCQGCETEGTMRKNAPTTKVPELGGNSKKEEEKKKGCCHVS